MTGIIGAGVLPKSFHPTEKQWYFLVGKEAFGTDSETWSDFGGRPIGNERALDTAAREGAEESRGVLGTVREIKSLLENDPCCTLAKVRKDKSSYYFLYTYPVHSEEMICKTQESCKCLVCSFAARASEVKTKDVSWKEKSELKWVPVNAVFQAVFGKNHTIVMGDVHCRLRNAFCYAIKSLPDYHNYARSHKHPKLDAPASSSTPPSTRFKFNRNAPPFIPSDEKVYRREKQVEPCVLEISDYTAPYAGPYIFTFMEKADPKLNLQTRLFKPWHEDKHPGKNPFSRVYVLSFTEDRRTAFEPKKYSFMDVRDNFDK